MSSQVGRRAFVVGGAAFLAAAACGGSDDDASGDRPSVSVTTAKGGDQLNMLVASVPTLATVPDQRVALMILQGQEPVAADTTVQVLFGQVQGQSVGQTIGPFPAERHADGLTRPYHLVRATFPAPGNYAIQATVNGKEVLAALEAVDPATDASPKPGQPMVATPTPTKASPGGVNPICTRDPACSLHEVSLDAALGEKRPVVLLVGTPQFCKTDTCGPVLDVLLDEMKAYADRVRFIHVEVYTDETLKQTVPAVQALKLQGEPVLFTVGADGVVRDRIPGPYDRAELRSVLAKL
jgi:hypothetical protein